jgi:hypothetical protein
MFAERMLKMISNFEIHHSLSEQCNTSFLLALPKNVAAKSQQLQSTAWQGVSVTL